jgi:uncharacterized protein (DUF302 family)
MARKAGIFVTGLVVGALLMGIIVYVGLPRMMFKVQRSALDFDSTVMSIENTAVSHGYKVPKVYDIQESLVSAGHADMTRLKVISLCRPDHTYSLLQHDENKSVSAIMPYRLAVYETADGGVYLSELNVGRLGSLFGGNIAEVTRTVAAEQDSMFSHLYAE